MLLFLDQISETGKSFQGAPPAPPPPPPTKKARTVTDLADDMDISIRLYDIEVSHRLSKREKAGRPIIVTFKSRKLRNKFYEPRKQRVGLKFIIGSVHCTCISQNH